MNVVNQVLPTEPHQLQAFMQPGPPGPIFMVNLLKFKDKAEYEDGRATTLSGREAYTIYGEAVVEVLKQFGGQAVFAGDVTHLILGLADELWDEVAIAMYPNRAAMVAMSMSEAWREIAVHRTAGLKGQLNIETVLPANAAATLVGAAFAGAGVG